MYTVKVNQGYNTVEFEFETADQAVEFIEKAVTNCNITTTFRLEYFTKVFVEKEGDNEDES